MEFPRRLQAVAERLSTGYFRLGLEELTRIYDERAYYDRLLMGEFLLRVGEAQQAQKLLRQTIDLPNITAAVKARCYEHLAYAVKQRDGLGESIRLYEKSLHLATKCDDLEQICRTQLWMMAAKADAFGPDTLGTLPSEVVSNTLKLGDPNIRLFLHTTFAEVEGRRASFELALRHIDLTMALLSKQQNLWIEARLYLLRGAISAATSDLALAIMYTSRALDVSRESGCGLIESAALCNLGQLCITAGKHDEASTYLHEARRLTEHVRSQRSAVIDNLAQLALANGRLDECQAWLSHQSVKDHDKRYVDVDNEATKLRLLQNRGNFQAALTVADAAIAAAAQRSAHLLHLKYRILRADVLVDMRRVLDAYEALEEIDIARLSLANMAEFERVQGRVAAQLGLFMRSRGRFERAARLLTYLGHTSSCDSVAHQAKKELEPVPGTSNGHSRAASVDSESASVMPESLVTTYRVLELGRDPVLLGLEAIELLRHSGVATRMALVAEESSERRFVHGVNWPYASASEATRTALRLQFGSDSNRQCDLLVEPTSQFGANEVIKSVFALVTTALELHHARRERTERTSLWPNDVGLPGAEPMFYGEQMREVRRQAIRMASSDLKVLITGETGVGKEIIAQLIHKSSKRADKRFEAVNCASVPRDLFEAHLFGHRKGAFTGAINDAPGVLQANNGGTIFFDEIGELSLDMQVKLLRVLEGREIHPLGAPQSISIDFRIIAATNADLHQLMEEKRFREDLFYRLNVATLRVPPLRERREEILPFAHYFLSLFCSENDKPLPSLSDEASEYLLLYNWPGNVRELRNEMERVAGLVEDGAQIKVSDLKPEIVASRRSKQSSSVEAGPNEIVVRIDQPLESAYEQIARHAILAALERNKGNLEATAKDLGLTRKGLYNKRLRFGML